MTVDFRSTHECWIMSLALKQLGSHVKSSVYICTWNFKVDETLF